MHKLYKNGNVIKYLWKSISELFSHKGDKTTNGDTTIITVLTLGSSAKGTGPPPSVIINVGRKETVTDSNYTSIKH